MQLVILAGGGGTRLKSVSGDLPKPLVRVLGVPLLGRQIYQAAQSDCVDEVLVLTGHGADQIQGYVDHTEFGIPVRCIAEHVARGTAGAVYDAMAELKQQFFCMYADTVNDVDLSRMLRFHETRNADATLFLHPNDHPADSDLVEIDDDRNITCFHPYPHPKELELPNLVNAALYVIRRDSLLGLHDLPPKPDFGKHIFAAMLCGGRRLAGYLSPEYIKDAGTPKRLARVAADIQSGLVVARSLRHRAAAVFLDRDGTLNELAGHINDPENLKLIPGAAAAVARLNQSPFRTVVVTNQPVVARGDASFAMLRRIHASLDAKLGAHGAFVDALYFCPHHTDAGFAGEVRELKIDCGCRKPKTGLVEQAACDLNLGLEKSWMIGDTSSDIEMARRAGMRSVLVRTGEGGRDGRYDVKADLIATDLAAAVDMILAQSQHMGFSA